MDDLRTQTLTFAAEVRCTDGRTLHGAVFMPAASRHGRVMLPEERLNESDSFLPFLPDGARHAVLLNKRQLVAVTVSMADHDRFTGDQPSSKVRRRVTLDCADQRYEGTIELDHPRYSNRVLDVLNGPERFVALQTSSSCHIIQKDAITQVSELDEGTLRPPPAAD